ncbi:MAG TPA: insulinase family protein, partial [Anaerolineae bacterium]|nr:insulinase family protein [Anaerolineae bacterium]
MEYELTALDNGLRIITSSMPHTHSVSVGFYLAVGSRYEEDDNVGVSHFIEHMLFKGTAHWPTAADLAAAIEGRGGVFNASTSQEITTYWVKVAQPHLAVALEVLVDMLRAPTFAPEEIEKERHVISEEISMTLDIPEELVGILSNQLTWPNHPLGHDIAGTQASIAHLQRETILNFLYQHYRPSGTVIGVAGNVSHASVVEALGELLADWSDGPPSWFEPAPPLPDKPRWRVVHRPIEQAHVMITLPGLPRNDPRRFALGLLNGILGEGMSSRLFQRVREQQGLAYSVESYASLLADTGIVNIYASVDPDRVDQAVRSLLNEVNRLREAPVSPEELHRAREYSKGRMLLSLEDTLAVSGWYGRQALLTNEILEVEQVIEALNAVTPEDIQQLAQDLFYPTSLTLAVVGPVREDAITQGLECLDNLPVGRHG